MNNSVKNALYTLGLLTFVFLLWKWRQTDDSGLKKIEIHGSTMGTTYSVIVFGESAERVKEDIDSLLIHFNKSMSTYDEASAISRFNNSDSLRYSDPWFFPVLVKSREIHTLSEGAFDPTIMPLVRIWGFGPDDLQAPDSSVVDSVKQLVDFGNIEFDITGVRKKVKGSQLDFSAIAKGYGVDLVSDLLYKMGFVDHFVEIGGEVRTRGVNRLTGEYWKVGITHPDSDSDNVKLYGALSLSDQSIATSGNYFNYYIKDGVKYSHTLDPDTGYPSMLRILSASVVSSDCMTADAWATAFMVMGHERAIAKMKELNIEGIILYSNEQGFVEQYISSGLEGLFHKIEQP